jgi:hypothetical protein
MSTLHSTETKPNTDKFSNFKLKTFAHSVKEIIIRKKRQPTGWEKILASCTADD